ncbi:zinc-binding metallopeptidase family protein [Nocardioides sp. J54]|uniref:zinc-binding metallopeptidase family protein n=1 Tax=Nocardioides sp. J54 TaxID=935866 RepID=UPI00048ECB92|nr:putative zinc-binding metallopeptidase [Nocardioides sp. J54]
MRAFSCRACGSPLFFENSTCVTCGSTLGFFRPEHDIVPLDPDHRYVDADGLVWHRCRNFDLSGCTWLARLEGGQCSACDHTRTRPNDHDAQGMAQLPTAEAAKRHLLVELDRLGFDVSGLVFDMLSSVGEDVVIGHADGVITIDLAESDDARRERVRVQLGEPYRTMLGHLRHEVGHFVQARLVTEEHPERLARCRELFGDETADYQAAIDRHYADGPPVGWEASYLSAYATMHPFEDFAETFAHHLHIADTCETAAAYGLTTADVTGHDAFRDLVREVWVPLSVALNQVNRSMGKDDLYPFVIPPPVLGKLDFVAALGAAG